MTLQMVTANGLGDGGVLYLAGDGGWSVDFKLGATASGAEADRLLENGRAAEARQIVIGAYLIDVEEAEGGLKPVRYREQIRADGPTV